MATATMKPVKLDELNIFIVSLPRHQERYQYVTAQLERMNITHYQPWQAVDAFAGDLLPTAEVDQVLIDAHRGGAGCAMSHVNLWKHIRDQQLGWTLILEDDAHFHPSFVELFAKYWEQVPADAMVIYPGYGHVGAKNYPNAVVNLVPCCTHGYIINQHGASELLASPFMPMKDSIDMEIYNYYTPRPNKFYLFNGAVNMGGVVPAKYKSSMGKKAMFEGIIYQNHYDFGTTLKSFEQTPI